MLALAELAAGHPPRRTLHFVAFDLEEYGLVGSTHCAHQWRQQNRPLHLMVSLEMLGYFCDRAHSQQYPIDLLGRMYPDQGNFIALIGNVRLVPTLMTMKGHLKQAGAPCEWLPVMNRGEQVPGTRNSDHAPFWDVGYSALMDRMARITQGLFKGFCRL